MTDTDRIAQMAREAGASFDQTFESVGDNPMWLMSPEDLARFALVLADDALQAYTDAVAQSPHVDQAALFRARYSTPSLATPPGDA